MLHTFMNSNKEDGDTKFVEDKAEERKPPTNYEEFIAAEKLREWPIRLDFESVLDTSEFPCWDYQEIYDEIHQSVNVGIGADRLQDSKTQIEKLDHQLTDISSYLIDENKPAVPNTNEKYSKIAAFLQNRNAKLLGVELRQQDLHLSERSATDGTRRVEKVVFPGYRARELTELPGRLEAPQILNQVTEVQSHNKGFAQVWKALFFSQASIALLHDTFWWTFFYKYQRNGEVEDKLFSRIADNYVALFSSAHPDIRDKFFNEYPRCLAQAVFLIFHKAYPDSQDNFTKEFADEIYNLLCEWFTGMTKSSQVYRKWPWDKLLTSKPDQAGDLVEKQDQLSFKLSLPKLGADDGEANTSCFITTNDSDVITEELSNTTMNDSTIVESSKHASNTQVHFKDASDDDDDDVDLSSFMLQHKHEQQKHHSSHRILNRRNQVKVARSLDVERVSFDTRGRTPLISHHLYMKQLLNPPSPAYQLKRTVVKRNEVATKPLKTHYEAGKTLGDILKKSKQNVDQLQAERKRTEEKTRMEIGKARKQVSKAIKELDDRLSAFNSSPSPSASEARSNHGDRASRMQYESGDFSLK